jgi:flagella basal body P-ring formation protein FlgA
VRSGDGVRIHFVRGVVAVTMPGRALRTGTEGELVIVRPDGSSDRFEGRVTGQKEVVVELP